MNSRRHEVPKSFDFTITDPEPYDQLPEKFASADELAWTDDEVREVRDRDRGREEERRARRRPGLEEKSVSRHCALP